MITKLITHSGSFHADDVLSYSLLSAMFPDATLLRTRDDGVISNAGSDAIVFDVGGECSIANKRYDHHQNCRALREDNRPYSSLGLVWMVWGRKFLREIIGIDRAIEDDVWAILDEGIVSTIDDVDNGTDTEAGRAGRHPLSLPSLVVQFRPDFDTNSKEAEDAGFIQASRLCLEIFKAEAGKAAAGVRAGRIVAQEIATRKHKHILELPHGMPYLEPLLASGDEEILYVVMPGKDEWVVDAVSVSLGSYENRKSFPEDWAGLRGTDLAAVTGVEDAVFCHANRFVAISKSRTGAFALADLAL